MDGVLDLAVCVLAAIASLGVLHWVIRRTSRRGAGVAPVSGSSGAASTSSAAGTVGCARHRWSPPRPRLRLTGTGLRDAGQRIRFCLDCAAEKTDDESTPDGAARH